MKTLPAMLGSGQLFWVIFLIPYLDIRNIHGKESCDVQLYIKRQSYHSIFAGDPFKLECPVKYCANRPRVTWCKLNGTTCVKLEDRHTSWKEEKNRSFFILHFEPVLPSDNGSYRCSANFLSNVIESHSTTLYVTGKQNELSDTAGREITLVDVPFKNEQTEASTRQNSQVLLSETGIYDNEPDFCFRMQEGSDVYSNPCLEENKPGIIYASLNHSIIGLNSRQARNVKEAPTEYASICVRS
ncbi:B- and T-lymphocyte attenuator isoform X2 [Piliocolobus tephrosceles]|uniref:B- and T-lymphocyte attenuator n=1 Tax=Piliocolobus tephrosceles TaxID=591936 RepID=A0A8C9HXV0_9PRIM|nr:B- and T-lymphocyte attenuator isoform X2 [Piliocolobus tephrosceles]